MLANVMLRNHRRHAHAAAGRMNARLKARWCHMNKRQSKLQQAAYVRQVKCGVDGRVVAGGYSVDAAANKVTRHVLIQNTYRK
jgi:hypothetical protein